MRQKLKPKLNYSVKNPSKFIKHKEAYLKTKTKDIEYNLVTIWQSYWKFDIINIGVNLLTLLKSKHPEVSNDFLFLPGDIEAIKGIGVYVIRFECRGLHNHLLVSGKVNLTITNGHLL